MSPLEVCSQTALDTKKRNEDNSQMATALRVGILSDRGPHDGTQPTVLTEGVLPARLSCGAFSSSELETGCIALSVYPEFNYAE